TTSRFLRGMEVQAIEAKSTTSITRHCLERDKGIVCTARNCRASHRRQGLAPRCRLVASWGWSRSQGLGCSPIKAVRELGLERKLHCVLLQKCSTNKSDLYRWNP